MILYLIKGSCFAQDPSISNQAVYVKSEFGPELEKAGLTKTDEFLPANAPPGAMIIYHSTEIYAQYGEEGRIEVKLRADGKYAYGSDYLCSKIQIIND